MTKCVQESDHVIFDVSNLLNVKDLQEDYGGIGLTHW